MWTDINPPSRKPLHGDSLDIKTNEEHITLSSPRTSTKTTNENGHEKDSKDIKFSFSTNRHPISVSPTTDIVSIAVSHSNPMGGDTWQVSRNGPNTVHVPIYGKPILRLNGEELSTQIAHMSMWDELAGSFKTFAATAESFHMITTTHLFNKTLHKDVFFVVHGWHGITNDTHIFLSAVRLLTRMMPTSCIIYLSWESQGAIGTAADAILLARRVNITQFLSAMPSQLRIHRMGHSLGSYVCGSICRQYHSLMSGICKGILGINPYEVLFSAPDLYARMHVDTIRLDAEYVAIFATTSQYLSTSDSDADEYIIVNDAVFMNSVCANPYEWNIHLCTTGYGELKSCERFGAANVTTSPGVVEDGSQICLRMLPIIAVLQSLDLKSPYPLLRIAPPDASNEVTHLPSIWNIYVVGKDYRYSTYAKNDSLWYSSAICAGYTGFSIPSVFTVFAPPSISLRVRAAVQQSSTIYKNITIYSAFLKNTSRYYPTVTLETLGPILSAYAWRGRMHNSSYYPLPLPEQEIMEYKCTHIDRTYTCIPTDLIYATTVWRQIFSMGHIFPVYPSNNCLPYRPTNAIIWRRPVLEIGVWNNITASFQRNKQLMALTFENHNTATNTTVLTFHDVCRESKIRSVVYFEYDWLETSMNITVLIPGLYTLRWFFPFEIIEMPVRVSYNNSFAQALTTSRV